MYVQVRLAAWAGSRLPSSKAVPKARGSRRRREGQSERGGRMVGVCMAGSPVGELVCNRAGCDSYRAFFWRVSIFL